MKRAMLAVLLIGCQKRDAAPPASWEPDRSCEKDDDCRAAPACCPAPCSSDVINKKDVGMVQTRVDAQCTKEARAKCPQAGSCTAHMYLCVRAKCSFVQEGSPDWPGCPKDLPGAVCTPCTVHHQSCSRP